MSVYIEGKQLPESCWKCWEWRNAGIGIYCALLCKNLRIGNGHPGKERKEWCPLIEIPPHGDLIERDELPISTAVPPDGKPYQYVHIDNIKNASIIIPAEKET